LPFRGPGVVAMTDVLVLNIDYQPTGRMTWQRAITQWVKGRIEIIDSYEDKDIKSVTFSMKMPAVVRELTRYRRKNAVKFSRENVYTRDKGRCQYCGEVVPRVKATYDHVLPRDLGGKTKWDNIVIACFECNQRKRNRTPEQANMRLLSKPVKPKHLPNTVRLTFTWQKGMPDQWKNWIYDVKYWHSEIEQEE
jgi:5-methylcytosine-specific restriction endonuclease McrA